MCAAFFDRPGYPAARCTFRPAFTHLLDARKERVEGGGGEVGDEPEGFVDGGDDHEIDIDGHPGLSAERHGQAADER